MRMGRVNGDKIEGRLEGIGSQVHLGGWCNKVKDRGWLASKLGGSKKKGKKTKKDDSGTP